MMMTEKGESSKKMRAVPNDHGFTEIVLSWSLEQIENQDLFKDQKNYIGNSQGPVSSSEEITSNIERLLWLSKHEVMLQDINGGCLYSLIKEFKIPVEDHGTMVQQVAGLAGTSRMPIVVDIIYVESMDIEVPIVDLVLDYDTIILDSMETYEPKSIPATKSSIEALEKIRFQPSSNLIQECSVCLEEFQIGFEVTSMSCSHVFHGKCIGKLLQIPS